MEEPIDVMMWGGDNLYMETHVQIYIRFRKTSFVLFLLWIESNEVGFQVAIQF